MKDYFTMDTAQGNWVSKYHSNVAAKLNMSEHVTVTLQKLIIFW